MVKMSSFGGGVGSMSRESRLREAAKIHIQLGNLQRYCELLVEVGEVSKAVSCTVRPVLSNMHRERNFLSE